MRVVLDTNLFVSMVLAKGGTLETLWRLWRVRHFEVLSSQLLLDEVQSVLQRPKLAKLLSKARYATMLRNLETLTLSVILEGPYPAFSDPDDRFLLAMVREGGADVLVTGDKALLELKTFAGVPVVSAVEFLRLLEDSSP